MSLLEAIVALVILGLAAVGLLEAFQTTSRATRNAEAWAQAVGYAESAMELTKIDAEPLADSLPNGFTRTVRVEPWPNAPALARVTVTITMPAQGRFTLERLVRVQ